jgi:isoleucyl-tRNA synthetase
VLRYYYCLEVAPWEIQKFSLKTAEEAKKILNIFWNCYLFFSSYGGNREKVKLTRVEDKWFMSKLNSLIEDVTKYLENFEFHRAGRAIGDFICNSLSRFYIKLVRDRLWVDKKGEDKDAASYVLYQALTTLCKLLAPITPFISEEIYQNLHKGKSAFESNWPQKDEKLVDKKLEEYMEVVDEVAEAMLYARQLAKLRLRWPVDAIYLKTSERRIEEAVKNCEEVLCRLCNTKRILIVSKEPKGEFVRIDRGFGTVFVEKGLSEEALEEAIVKELIRYVQDRRKSRGLNVRDAIKLYLSCDEETSEIIKKFSETIKRKVGAKEILLGGAEGEHREAIEIMNRKIEIGFKKVD